MERLLLALLYISTLLAAVAAEISNLRLCADEQCEEPVSKGITLINYPRSDKDILSFPVNAKVTVYSKEAGERQDLWGVEIGGKRGYVPKQYVKEEKILRRDLKFEVSTEAFIRGEESRDDPHKDTSVNEDSYKDDDVVERKDNKDVRTTNLEEIAINAEDVEYNRLKLSDTEEKKSFEETTVSSHGNEKEQKSHSDGNDEADGKSKEEYEGKEEKVDEEDEGSAEGSKSIEKDHGDQLETDAIDKEDETTQKKDLPEALENIMAVDPLPHSDAQNPSTVTPSVKENESIDRSIDAVEPTSAKYEVIDGTTLYDDEVITATHPALDVVSSVVLEASSAIDENFVSVHPPPLLSQASFDAVYSQNVDIKPTATPGSGDSGTAVPDIVSSSWINEISEQLTNNVLAAEEPPNEVQIDEAEPNIAPSSSWLTHAATSVSSWLTGEEKKVTEKEGSKTSNVDENAESVSKANSHIPPDANALVDDSIVNAEVIASNEAFGEPNPDVIDDLNRQVEEVTESGSLFSSWFGSSENTDSQETEVPVEIENLSEPDTVSNDLNEVDPNIAAKNGRADGSKADPIDSIANIASTDTVDVPVDETENPENIAQTPYSADNVDDIAYNTQHHNPSPVDANPDSSSSPSLEQYSEMSLRSGGQIPEGDLIHKFGEVGGSSEEDANINAG